MTSEQAKQQVEAAIGMLIHARDVYDAYDFNEAELLANNALAMLLPLEEMPGLGDETDTNSLKYNVLYHIAHAYNRLMVVALSLADFMSAFDYGAASIGYAEKIHYYNRISQIYINLGAVYMSLDENLRAIEYCRKGLAIAGEYCELSYSIGALVNLGEAYRRNGDYSKSLECSLEALSLSETDSSTENINLLTGNIGVLYMDIGEYSNALEYLLKAFERAINSNDKRLEIMWLGYLGRLYCNENFEGLDIQKAEEYFLQSFSNIEEFKLSKFQYRKNYKFMAALFHTNGEYAKAYEYLNTFIELENEGKSAETKKEATKFDYAHKTAEREKQYAIERADAEATKRLLHKTLPKSIADRVIQGEVRIADYFQSVSVLFADVVGFTKISSKMPPAAVLAFMNFIFEHFDALAAKHGCERIKTIGDGYMAVCGAPVRYPNHVERLALMALNMMEDIQLPEEIRQHLPKGTLFHLRIGLHCGEITAGLIGTGKLAYDIYGDAVNTAARMESHGEPNKIHVSEEFAFHLQNRMDITNDPLGGIVFIEREEIEIKGKGMMKTYFMKQPNTNQ